MRFGEIHDREGVGRRRTRTGQEEVDDSQGYDIREEGLFVLLWQPNKEKETRPHLNFSNG